MSSALKWPSIKPKKNLQLVETLPDQIYLLDGLLDKNECHALLSFARALDLEGPKPPGRNEATRLNHRFQTYAPDFAATLWTLLSPHLSNLPIPTSKAKLRTPTPTSTSSSTPTACYPKIRIYRYDQGSFFGPHYDESVVDTETGYRSVWTLLIYLTGEEDGVKGGHTVFWTKAPNSKGKNGTSLAIPLRAGRVLLHKHGVDCLLHEGARVEEGQKWVLRSDLMVE